MKFACWISRDADGHVVDLWRDRPERTEDGCWVPASRNLGCRGPAVDDFARETGIELRPGELVRVSGVGRVEVGDVSR